MAAALAPITSLAVARPPSGCDDRHLAAIGTGNSIGLGIAGAAMLAGAAVTVVTTTGSNRGQSR